MDSLFQELKSARESKRLSLNDVSDVTLINVNFLEAIEQGNITILPQPYVRAFIREYATFVGLDPVEIMKRYDQMKETHSAPSSPEQPPAAQPALPPEDSTKTEPPSQEAPIQHTPALARFALPAILILTFAVVIWNLTRTKEPPVGDERPIEQPIKEATADSAAKQPVVKERRSVPTSLDSLTLHATVSDTVWVQIVIDRQQPLEYVFRPGRRISWKAQSDFRLNIGNAGAIELTLNDKHLGAVGKLGAVVRNIDINRQTLRQK